MALLHPPVQVSVDEGTTRRANTLSLHASEKRGLTTGSTFIADWGKRVRPVELPAEHYCRCPGSWSHGAVHHLPLFQVSFEHLGNE